MTELVKSVASGRRWQDSIEGAARDGRTALLLGWTLALIVSFTGPEESFALYGRLMAGSTSGADAGRLLFMGTGCVQATLLGLAVGLASLALRAGIRVARAAAALVAAHRQAAEAAHV